MINGNNAFMPGYNTTQILAPTPNVPNQFLPSLGVNNDSNFLGSNQILDQGIFNSPEMNMNIPGVNGGGGGFMDSMLGYTDASGMQHNGWGGMALGLGSALYGGWMANKQLGLAEDNMQFQKDAFNRNFVEQKRLNERAYGDKRRTAASSNK